MKQLKLECEQLRKENETLRKETQTKRIVTKKCQELIAVNQALQQRNKDLHNELYFWQMKCQALQQIQTISNSPDTKQSENLQCYAVSIDPNATSKQKAERSESETKTQSACDSNESEQVMEQSACKQSHVSPVATQKDLLSTSQLRRPKKYSIL